MKKRAEYPDGFFKLPFASIGLFSVSLDADGIRKAINENPSDPRPHIELAIAFIAEERLDEAIGECERALQLFDEDIAFRTKNIGLVAFTHYLLGISYDRTGQTYVACEEWKRAVELHPDGVGRAARTMLERYPG